MRASQCIIFSRKRGTWHLKWFADDGKPHRKQLGTIHELPTRASAEKAAQPFRKLLRKPTKEIPTVAQLATQYTLEKMSTTRVSTSRSLKAWLKNHVIPAWGNTAITDVQARPVELWLRQLKLSPKSRAHIRNLMHSLLDFAMWAGVLEINRNPMDLVVVRGASKRTRQPRSLTVDGFRLFLAQLSGPFRTMALVAVSFGLRISELLALKWSDVDWLNSRLTIERGIVRGIVDAVKTEYSGRAMSIDAAMLGVLKAWRQETQFAAVSDWIFASPVALGRLPWSYPHVLRVFTHAGKDAGIGKLSPHTLRHTYRAWLDAVGTPIAVQQKLMRHASITTTLNIYGDVVTDEMAQAHSKVVQLALSKQ
jgi:integrase